MRTRPPEPVDCTHPQVRHNHGTYLAYTHDGCGCPPCTEANAETERQRRRATAQMFWRGEQHFYDATGTRRRLEALHRMGWSSVELAAMLGVDASCVRDYRTKATVEAGTRASVIELYERLWDKKATGRYQLRVIRHAERMGWAAPLEWDDIDHDPKPQTGEPVTVDEVRVLRACEGRLQWKELNRAEQHETVRRLAARGVTDRDAGRLLGITGVAVGKVRERNGIASSYKPPARWRDGGEAA